MTVFEIIGYLSISFLPAILPMALLFAVLMSYGRLSADSEITALRASGCLLYTSDAADERSSVDLGGRRIIKKKTKKHNKQQTHTIHTLTYSRQPSY